MAVPTKEEAKGIYRIGPLDVKIAHQANTSPFLVVGQKQAVIIEPGEAGQAPELIAGIKQLGVKLEDVAYIIPSHIHLHHVQGAPVLLKSLPRARVVTHPRGVPHLVNVDRLMESTIAVWGDKCYEAIAPIPPDKVISAADGQLLDLGGRELEIIHTIGHASHHISIFDRLTKTLWPGDLDTGVGSYGPPGGPGVSTTIFDVDLHVDSMQRLIARNPTMLLTFGPQHPLSPDSLKNVVVDLRAVERICRESLKSKCTLAEIDRRVREYNDWAKATQVFGGAELSRGSRGGTALGVSGGVAGGAPPHLIGFLFRQEPSLPVPSDLPERRGDNLARRR